MIDEGIRGNSSIAFGLPPISGVLQSRTPRDSRKIPQEDKSSPYYSSNNRQRLVGQVSSRGRGSGFVPSERNYSVFRSGREFNKQGAGFFLTSGSSATPPPVSAGNSSEKWKTTVQRPYFFSSFRTFPIIRRTYYLDPRPRFVCIILWKCASYLRESCFFSRCTPEISSPDEASKRWEAKKWSRNNRYTRNYQSFSSFSIVRSIVTRAFVRMLKCVQKSTLIDRRCQDSKSSGIDRVVQRPDRLIERRPSDKRKRKITEAKGLTMRRRRANSGIIWVNKRSRSPSWLSADDFRGKSTTLSRHALFATNSLLVEEFSRREVKPPPSIPPSQRPTPRPCLSFPLGKSRWIFFNLVHLSLPPCFIPSRIAL